MSERYGAELLARWQRALAREPGDPAWEGIMFQVHHLASGNMAGVDA
ncbi:MAG: hypothetical protein M3314_04370 [Actinomycetota bacterium]|nr:hypothetical protein [Actinomycetota bacterium]